MLHSVFFFLFFVAHFLLLSTSFYVFGCVVFCVLHLFHSTWCNPSFPPLWGTPITTFLELSPSQRITFYRIFVTHQLLHQFIQFSSVFGFQGKTSLHLLHSYYCNTNPDKLYIKSYLQLTASKQHSVLPCSPRAIYAIYVCCKLHIAINSSGVCVFDTL